MTLAEFIRDLYGEIVALRLILVFSCIAFMGDALSENRWLMAGAWGLLVVASVHAFIVARRRRHDFVKGMA